MASALSMNNAAGQQNQSIDQPETETKELRAFGAGLKSISDIVRSKGFANLQSLCLHGNSISTIEGLDGLLCLENLNLSSNSIKRMEGLSSLTQLKVLDLSSNLIEEIRGLEGLTSLVRLALAHNRIEKLRGLAVQDGPGYSIQYLDLRGNRIHSISELWFLAGCVNLQELLLANGRQENPVCKEATYASTIVSVLPYLELLDGRSLLTHNPRESINCLRRVKLYSNFDPPLQMNAGKLMCYLSKPFDSLYPQNLVYSPQQLPKKNGLLIDKASPNNLFQVELENSEVPMKPKSVDWRQNPCGPQISYKMEEVQHTGLAKDSLFNTPTTLSCSPKVSQGESSLSSDPQKVQQVTSGNPNQKSNVVDDYDPILLTTDMSSSDQQLVDGKSPQIDHNLIGFYKKKVLLQKKSHGMDGEQLDRLNSIEARLKLLESGTALCSNNVDNIKDEKLQPAMAEEPNDCQRYNNVVQTFLVQKAESEQNVEIERQVKGTKNDVAVIQHNDFKNHLEDRGHGKDSEKHKQELIGAAETEHKDLADKSYTNMLPMMESVCVQTESYLERDMQKDLIQEKQKSIGTIGLEQNCSADKSSTKILPMKASASVQTESYLECNMLKDQIEPKNKSIGAIGLELNYLADRSSIEMLLMKEYVPVLTESYHKYNVQKHLKEHKRNGSTYGSFAKMLLAKESICTPTESHMESNMHKELIEEKPKNAPRTTEQTKSNDNDLFASQCTESTEENIVFQLQAELIEKEAEILKYKEGIMKMETMMKANGNLDSTLLQENILESVASAKSEAMALKAALDASKHSQQVAQTLLRQVSLERNNLRQSLSKMTKDSEAKLQQIDVELETCKLRELSNVEEIKRLSSIINMERIDFQRQLSELKLLYQNRTFQESFLGYNLHEGRTKYPLHFEIVHDSATNQRVTTNMQTSIGLQTETDHQSLEIEAIKAKAMRAEELAEEVEFLQNKLAQTESYVAVDIEKRFESLVSENSSLSEENKRLSANLSDNIQKLVSSEDALRIKNKMLDSQNDTIRELKSTISDLNKRLAEKDAAMDSLELDFTRRLQIESDQVNALQNEVSEQDALLSDVEEELQKEKKAKTDAELAKSTLQRKLAEKNEMLRYVESQIEHARELYEKREKSITSERDKALESLQSTKKEKLELECKCEDLQKQLKALEEEKTLLQTNFECVMTEKEALEKKEQQLMEDLSNKTKEILEYQTELSSATAALNAQNTMQEKMKDAYISKVNQLCKAMQELREVDICID